MHWMHPGGSASRGSASRGVAPSQLDAMGYGQRADGTHPTGMRSCFTCKSTSNSSFMKYPIIAYI